MPLLHEAQAKFVLIETPDKGNTMTKEELKKAINEIEKGTLIEADKLRNILLAIVETIEKLESK